MLKGFVNIQLMEYLESFALTVIGGIEITKPPLVVTTCSTRKMFPALISASSLEHGSQATVSQSWLRQISKAPPQAPAYEMYRGRAFQLALRAAKLLGADLVVVSAGLGFVPSTRAIPSYDLTLSRAGIRGLVDGPFDIDAWWTTITAGPFSSEVAMELYGRKLVLTCVSSTYMPLIATALESCLPSRLRIFGAGIAKVLPPALASCVMPYDSRLNVTYSNGLQTDFAQRALLHYASELYSASNLRLADDKRAIHKCFAYSSRPKSVPKRKQLTDAEIKAIIKRLLPIVGTRKTAMLRHVRDVEVVACEQERFARLFVEVLAQ